VPYAAPKVVRTMEHAQPMAPKKEAYIGLVGVIMLVEYGYSIKRGRNCVVPAVHVCEEFSVHFDLILYVL
jgi:hypothetical protein